MKVFFEIGFSEEYFLLISFSQKRNGYPFEIIQSALIQIHGCEFLSNDQGVLNKSARVHFDIRCRPSTSTLVFIFLNFMEIIIHNLLIGNFRNFEISVNLNFKWLAFTMF